MSCPPMRLPKPSPSPLSFPHRHLHTILFLLLLYYIVLQECVITHSHLNDPLKSPLSIRTPSLPPNLPTSPQLPSELSNIRQLPLVTVILTAYNVRPYIDVSVNATLSQSYQNLQIIIIDDASIDHTSERIAALTAHDSRVTHIRFATNTFGGVSTPSNIGIEAAEGKYIAFIDGDDIPMPDFIAKLVAVAEKSKADFTYSNFALFENQSNTTVKAYDLNNWPSPELTKLSQVYPFHPRLYPATFNLSPVPWRKLYRTDFLLTNNIRFPEGDYFFEDNSFHWLVNIHATRISFLPDTLILHRVGLASQTTSSLQSDRRKTTSTDHHTATARQQLPVRTPEEQAFVTSLASAKVLIYVPNINNVGYRVAECLKTRPSQCQFVRIAFLKWVVASKWILGHVKSSHNAKILAKATSVHQRVVNYWLHCLDGHKVVGRRATTNLQTIILSIVVPVYNVKQFLPDFVKLLNKLTIKTEVIFVDDNSSDGTMSLLKEITASNKNMYVLHAYGSGAGRARNFGLMFCEGEYVMFLDADDEFRPWVLDSAVWYASAEEVDVLMLKYELQYMRRRTNRRGFEVKSTTGMFNSDKDLWRQLLTADTEKRKMLSAKMTNYPWTKLVRRELLMRENIFFGPTIVNNDVQYHWHSIFATSKLDFFDEEALVRHRKFEDRTTLTEENGASRLELLDSLAMTNRVLVTNGVAENKPFREAWREFSKNLIRWGLGRVGKEVKGEYEQKAKEVMTIINSEHKRDILVAPR